MNLEEKVFYRFIKTTYIFLLVALCVVAICVIWFTGTYFLPYCVLFLAISSLILSLVKESVLYIAYGKKISFNWVNRFYYSYKNKEISNYKNNVHSEPEDVVNILIKMISENKKPFSDWKSDNVFIPENLEGLTIMATTGYSIYIYLLLIRKKFGAAVANYIRKQLILSFKNMNDIGGYLVHFLELMEFILSSTNEIEVNLLMDNSNKSEYRAALFFLVNLNLEDNPFYLPDEDRYNKTYGELTEHCTDEVIFNVGACLIHTKNMAISVFSPIISSISFKPTSLAGIAICPEIIWSINPGCFEGHLKRKFNNPLFSEALRRITQEDVDQARDRDFIDSKKLHENFDSFINAFPVENVTVKDMIEQRAIIDDLTGRAFENGGESLNLIPRLAEIRQRVINSVKDSLKDDKDGLDKLTKVDDAYKEEYQSVFNNVFVQQIIREHSPIQAELTSSVLSESIDNIKSFIQITSKEAGNHIEQFKNEAIEIVNKMIYRGDDISLLNEKLQLLEENGFFCFSLCPIKKEMLHG